MNGLLLFLASPTEPAATPFVPAAELPVPAPLGLNVVAPAAVIAVAAAATGSWSLMA